MSSEDLINWNEERNMKQITIKQFLDTYEFVAMNNETGELIDDLYRVVMNHPDDLFRMSCVNEARKLFIDAAEESSYIARDNPSIAELEGITVPRIRFQVLESPFGSFVYDTERGVMARDRPFATSKDAQIAATEIEFENRVRRSE